MGHDHSHSHSPHSHGHSHGVTGKSKQRLLFAFALNFSFALIEIVGGILTNSVAVLSNAFHDLGDSFSLGMSWYLEHVAHKKKDDQFSYGYARFSVLGALLNSVVLVVGSVFVLAQAVPRLFHPEEVSLAGMTGFALLGLSINVIAAWRLHGGESLNEKVVMWHLVEDVLGWLAVLIVSIGMQIWDAPLLDPVLSILVTLFILYNIIGRTRETLKVFLQAVPEAMQLHQIQKEILAITGVQGTHHARLWSLDGSSHVFSAHVVLHAGVSPLQSAQVKAQIKLSLKKFAIDDVTIEIEQDSESCDSLD